MKRLYMINPRTDYPFYFGAEAHIGVGLTLKAYSMDQATTTVAALAPPDFQVEICEEAVQSINWETTADYVGITGKISQWNRMKEIASRFLKKGKTVIIGGPHATLSPDIVRPYCDILVIGELEGIHSTFFDDLARSSWHDTYTGTHPALNDSVLPHVNLYPNNQTLFGTLQTSRGCPFNCDFCDVVQYLGKQQRHKSEDRLLAELDNLYSAGYRDIFITDDNFAANKRKTKEKLRAFAQWNGSKGRERVTFFTQASIESSQDDELLTLCAQAGVDTFFIGLETTNPEALREVGKNNNLKHDYTAAISRILNHKIQVAGGIIVGFDSDGLDIFEKMHAYFNQLPVPVLSLGCLVAPRATPLFERMKEQNRILNDAAFEVAALPWNTNIKPMQMTREQLFEGMRWLCSKTYQPEQYLKRVNLFLDAYNYPEAPCSTASDSKRNTERDYILDEYKILIQRLAGRGAGEAALVETLLHRAATEPRTERCIFNFLSFYCQVRCVYDTDNFYQPELASLPAPTFKS